MKKKIGIVKRMSCLLLIFLLSINSFAAIVSDNDGSAFITKAEFDALKSSFQSQIDSYNQSIDSKIDGAIASYLAGIKLSTQQELDIIYDKQNPTGKEGSTFLWYKDISAAQDKYSKLEWQWVGADEDVYATKIENRGGSSSKWYKQPSQRYLKFYLKIKSKKYELDVDPTSSNPRYINKYGKVYYTTTGNQVMTTNNPDGWNPFLLAQATWPRYSQAETGTDLLTKSRSCFSRYAAKEGTTPSSGPSRDWTTDVPDLGTYAVGDKTYPSYETVSITDKVIKEWELLDKYPVAVLNLHDEEYCQTSITNSSTFYYETDAASIDWAATGAIGGAHCITFTTSTPTGTRKLEPFGTDWVTSYFWATGNIDLLQNIIMKIFDGNDMEVDMQDRCLYGDWTTALSKPIIETFWGLRIKNNKVNKKYSQIPLFWNYNKGISKGTSAGIVITDKIQKDGKLTVTGKASENGYMWIYCSNTGDYNWEITNRADYTTKFKSVTKNTVFTFDNVECVNGDFCFVVFIPENNNGATITFDSATLTFSN